MKNALLTLIVLIFMTITGFAFESENFDGFDIGIIPPNWTSDVSDGEYGIVVAEDPSNSANRVLKISSNNITRTTAAAFFDQRYRGLVTVEYKIRFQNTGSALQHIGAPASDGIKSVSLMAHYGQFIFPDGTQNLYLGNWVDNKWYNIRLEMDTGAFTYTVFIDDVMLVESLPISKSALGGFDSFLISANNATVYLDDLSIRKTGDSLTRDILFYSNTYKVDYENQTIGNIRPGTDPQDVLDSIVHEENAVCTIENDILNVTDTLTGAHKFFTLLYRKSSLSALSNTVFLNTLIFEKNSSVFWRDGVQNSLNTSVFEQNGKIFIPLQTVIEYLGASISWDANRFLAVVQYKDAQYQIRPGFNIINQGGYRARVIAAGNFESFYSQKYVPADELISALRVDGVVQDGRYVAISKNPIPSAKLTGALWHLLEVVSNNL